MELLLCSSSKVKKAYQKLCYPKFVEEMQVTGQEILKCLDETKLPWGTAYKTLSPEAQEQAKITIISTPTTDTLSGWSLTWPVKPLWADLKPYEPAAFLPKMPGANFSDNFVEAMKALDAVPHQAQGSSVNNEDALTDDYIARRNRSILAKKTGGLSS